MKACHLRSYSTVLRWIASVFTGHSAGPSLELLDITPDLQVSLRLTGSDTIDYSLESSTNLTQWTELRQVSTTNQSAVVQVSFPATPRARFFRARDIPSALT